MSRIRKLSTIIIATAPIRPNDEVTMRLVVASFRNGSMTESERETVLKAAQRAGVTTWEYLRGRLLMQASIVLSDTVKEQQYE